MFSNEKQHRQRGNFHFSQVCELIYLEAMVNSTKIWLAIALVMSWITNKVQTTNFVRNGFKSRINLRKRIDFVILKPIRECAKCDYHSRSITWYGFGCNDNLWLLISCDQGVLKSYFIEGAWIQPCLELITQWKSK